MEAIRPQTNGCPNVLNNAAAEHAYITPRLRHLVYAYFSRRLDKYDSVIDAAADAQQLLNKLEIKYQRKYNNAKT